jgi:hypothetical protein
VEILLRREFTEIYCGPWNVWNGRGGRVAGEAPTGAELSLQFIITQTILDFILDYKLWRETNTESLDIKI